jgi:uncharacterized protein
MVNHACNLRCTYCYTGAKFSSPMPLGVGMAAIRRAFGSLVNGGRLDLGFFGGEPLLEPRRILEWMRFARSCSADLGKPVRFNITTNGTITGDEVWQIMLADDLDLAVSFDGAPHIHDRHRRDAQSQPTAARVEATIGKLVVAGKPMSVIFVVRPENLDRVPEGLAYLQGMGVRQIDLSLDLWTTWTAEDGRRLEKLVDHAALLWRQWMPEFSLNWFDAKAAALARLPVTEERTLCGFGEGEIAVAPSGRLYPCERVIGEDRPDHPLRLPGAALEGDDFLSSEIGAFARCEPCGRCALAAACDTTCRCSNFIRTGDVNRPDGLLCILNKAAARATANVLKISGAIQQHSKEEEHCYAK